MWGSSQSRRASPRRLKARTAVMTASAGKITRCGASKRWLRASLSMAPQLGMGAMTPTPRKLSVDSARIAPAMAMVACTRMGWRIFGSRWRARMRASDAPSERAAGLAGPAGDDERENYFPESGTEKCGERDGQEDSREREKCVD